MTLQEKRGEGANPEQQLQHLLAERKKTVELLAHLHQRAAGKKHPPAEEYALRQLLREQEAEIRPLQEERAGYRQRQSEKKEQKDKGKLFRLFGLLFLLMFLTVNIYVMFLYGSQDGLTTSAVMQLPEVRAREHYTALEEPQFTLVLPADQENALTGFSIASKSPLSSRKIKKENRRENKKETRKETAGEEAWMAAQLRIPDGKIVDLWKSALPREEQNEPAGQNKYTFSIPKRQRSFMPGKYTLYVVINEGQMARTIEQNFTWGVLALNPHKSVYREGEEAFLGMAVLDDKGEMVCDASVYLAITGPTGNTAVLSTDNGKILATSSCGVKNITSLPDYLARYVVGAAGSYTLNLTAVTGQGRRQITDQLVVEKDPAFDVSRSGPTRIFPAEWYSMNITIRARDFYQGLISEVVPSSFATIFATVSRGQTEFSDGGTVLSWNVTLIPGKNYTFSYLLDAPDESPQFYLLGPLEIGRWQEARQWQIAADALTGVTLDTPVANLSNVTSDTFTFTCTPTCDGVSDPANVVISYRYSTASTCSSPTDIDTVAGADVLSIDGQNDSTTCGTAANSLVTARNAGTAYISCRVQAFPSGDFTGGCREVAITQGCGTISANVNLNQNLTASGTCFTVNADHITVNCTNYGINYGGGGTADTYGLDINNGNDNVTIKNCLIQEVVPTGDRKYGIQAQNGAIGTKIFNSSVRTFGQSSVAIRLTSGSNSTNITDVTVETRNVSALGIQLFQSSHNLITNAIVRTAEGSGLLLVSAHNNTLEAVNVTVTGQAQGVRMVDAAGSTGVSNNWFINLTAWAAINYSIFDDTGSANNTLLYNSTFALINWTRANLTTNMTLWPGLTIFTQNRTIGVLDDGTNMERINTTAKITFRTLQYLVTPMVLKRGERCDNTIHCNVTRDYDKALGVLTVNVSSFSNYTLNSPPTQNNPVLNTTDPGTNNTNQNLTLYPQNASDPDQDNIKNITLWRLNGTSIMMLNMPFERINATSTANTWDYAFLNNASEQNGVLWNATGGFDGRGAYRFDGVNDYLEIPSTEKGSHGVLNFTGNFTLLAWIYRGADSGSYEHLLSKSSDIQFDYFLSVFNDTVHAGLTNSSGSTQNITGNGAIPVGRWHYLGVSFNGTTFAAYINGEINQTNHVNGSQVASAVPFRMGRLLDGNGFDGHIDEVLVYNRSLSAVQIRALFRNQTGLIASAELTSGQNWTAEVIPNDGFSDGASARSNQVIVVSVVNNRPTAPLTGRPFNDSAITNRTPIFDWFNSSDAEGDVISYHIQMDDNRLFNTPEINVSSIQDLSSAAPGNTTWYSTVELAVDTRYYWRVRANDSDGFGPWSDGSDSSDGLGGGMNLSNFTVDSLLSITMMTSVVEFGEISPGTEANTSDGVPAPFRAENTGNIDANVSLNASALLVSVAHNRSNYQFKIRENESSAFSTSLSALDWVNMSASDTRARVVNLSWRESKNDFLTDINLTIPNDEPAGYKTSTITFTLTRNE